MKIFFKILLIIFSVILITLLLSYYIFLSPIRFEKDFSRSEGIKDLDKKVFWSFYNTSKQKVTTDFSLESNENDTVIYQCSSYEINKFPKIENINFHFTTGYNGNQVNIYRFGNRFFTEIDDFSDNETSEDDKKYKILSQKLILNQKDFKVNDSIFGRIEIKFLDFQNNSTHEAVGNFRTIAQ